jgi:hypothetical protein
MTSALLFALAGGCGAGVGSPSDGADDGPNGKADDPNDDPNGDEGGASEAALAHQDAVELCEELADRVREHTNEERFNSLAKLEKDRFDCLKAANQSVVDHLETKLRDSTSNLAGTVQQSFDGLREAVALECEILGDASPYAVEKRLRATVVGCEAEGEWGLGELLDGFADLGATPVAIDPARMVYVGCHAAFDSAPQTTTEEKQAAMSELAVCINKANLSLAKDIAQRILQSFPGRNLAAEEKRWGDTAVSVAGSAAKICGALTAAGFNAGDPQAAIDAAACEVGAAVQAGDRIAALTGLVPANPPGDEPPLPDEPPPPDPPPPDDPSDGG